MAGERENEVGLQEVSEEELSRYNWKLCQRTDGDTFTILVGQRDNVERALSEGVGVCARHRLPPEGRGRIIGSHIDLLERREDQGRITMNTVVRPYPLGRHDSYVVLEQIS